MVRAALCIGGEMPHDEKLEHIIRNVDMTAAADSGFDALWELGIKPNLIVGDMDSTRYGEVIETFPKENVETSVPDKDETDTEIGLRRLHELGADYVILVGGGGGRLDHLLGIISLFERELRPREWFTENERVVSIEERMAFEGLLGETVSLFPLGTETTRINSKGLKWPLDDLVWKRGDVGISNLVIESPLVLEPKEGRALFISPLRRS